MPPYEWSVRLGITCAIVCFILFKLDDGAWSERVQLVLAGITILFVLTLFVCLFTFIWSCC